MRNDAGINGDAQRIEQIAWILFLKVYDAQEENWEFDQEDYVSIIPEECRWRNWAVDDGKGNALTGDQLLDFVNNRLFPVLKGTDVKDASGKILLHGIQVDKDTPINKAIVQATFQDANQYMKDGVLLEHMADFAAGTGGFMVSWLKELSKQVKDTEDSKALSESVYGVEKKQFPYMLCVTNLLLHGVDVPRVYHGNSLMHDVLDYTEKDQFDVILMNPPYGGSEKNDVKNHFPSELASSETADLFMSVIMYRLKQDGRAAVILPDGFLFGTDNTKVAIKKKLLTEFNLHTIIRMPGSVFSPYTSITTNILFFDHTGATRETWFYRLDMPEGYKHFSKTKPMKSEHFDPVREWWNNRTEIKDQDTDTWKAKKYTAQEIADGSYNLDLCGYPHEEEEILAPLDLIQQYQEKRASLNAEIDHVLDEIVALLPHDEGGEQ